MSLNPYSTGSWVAVTNGRFSQDTYITVLILILLEVGLLFAICTIDDNFNGLNPYSTGSWVAVMNGAIYLILNYQVLILILLEVGLLSDCTNDNGNYKLFVLILILLEVGLLSRIAPGFVFEYEVLILILLEVGLLCLRSK